MKRTAIARTAGLAGLALLAAGATALAQYGALVPPAPIPPRVVQTDTIVVGKFGKAEAKTVSATFFPGAETKLDYRVLELKVEEGLRGAKNGDVIRFGFMVPEAKRAGHPEGQVYTTGQECLFFLSKHHDESFFIAVEDYPPIDKRQASYAKDLELTRRCVKLLEDPMAGLRAKDAEARLLTAGMLISRYCSWRPGKNGPETEPIPADESKLILNILADADWAAKVAPGSSVPIEKMPASLFFQLDVSFKDGWGPPQGADLNAAAKQWVKDHANTYRIQRFVPAAAGKSDTKGKKD